MNVSDTNHLALHFSIPLFFINFIGLSPLYTVMPSVISGCYLFCMENALVQAMLHPTAVADDIDQKLREEYKTLAPEEMRKWEKKVRILIISMIE